MGNSAATGSSAAKVQHFIKAKYSLTHTPVAGDTLRATLTELASICSGFENPELLKTIGTKEIRFSLQIVSELVDIALNECIQLPIRLCSLEALQAVLAVQPICRRAIEVDDGVPRLLLAMKPTSIEMFIGSLGVVLKVFRSLDADSSTASFFQTLMRCSCIQKFFIFVTQASVVGADNMLCASIVILDLICWSFSRNHSILTSLRPSVRHIAFQHKDSLFELSRHPVRKLSYLTTMLLIRLMISGDKTTCLAIQDAAQSYGSILWTFQKVVCDIYDKCNDGRPGEDEAESTFSLHSVASSSLCTYAAGENSAEGYNCFHFDESEDVVSTETVLPSQLLLALYCTGNEANMDMIRRAVPPSMGRCLSFQGVDVKRERLQISSMSPNSPSVERVMAELPLTLIHSLMPGTPGSAMGGDAKASRTVKSFFKSTSNRDAGANSMTSISSGDQLTGDDVLALFFSKIGETVNWSFLFDLLGSAASTPRLEWNKKTLRYLRDRVGALVENLDFSRRLRHEAWDCTFMDVRYSHLDGLPCVNGLFVERLLHELIQGSHEQYIDSPPLLAAGLLERALVLPQSFSRSEYSCCGDQEALLCLRVLYLLMLRYPLQLQGHISVSSLYCLLQRGGGFHPTNSESNKGGRSCDGNIYGSDGLEINPLWIKRVCDILCISLKKASVENLNLFSSSGSMPWLLRILSNMQVVNELMNWKQYASTFQENPSAARYLTGSAEDAIDSEDVSEAGESESDNEEHIIKHSCDIDPAGKSASTTDIGTDKYEYGVVDSVRQRASSDIGRTTQQMLFEGFEGGSLTGEQVYVSAVNVVHRALSLSASLTADIDPLQRTVSVRLDGIAKEIDSTFTSITKMLWLTSVHGPFGPIGIPTCVDRLIEIVLRVLRTRRDCFVSMAQSETFIRVLVSISITATGSGNLTTKIAELLSDLVSGVMLLRKDTISSSFPAPLVQRFSLIELPAMDNISEEVDKELLAVSIDESGPEQVNLGGDPASSETAMVTMPKQTSSVGMPTGPIRRRSSYRESLLLAAHSSGITRAGETSGSSADAVKFLKDVIPLQFVRLCTLLNPHNLTLLFNSKADIATAEFYWNSQIRLQYLARLSRQLQQWHKDSFGSNYEPLENLFAGTMGASLLASSAAMEKTDAEKEVHVHGVYLRFFVACTPDSFVGYFNPSNFVADVIRKLDLALREFRISFPPEATVDGVSNASAVPMRMRTKSMSFSVSGAEVADGSDKTLEQVMVNLGTLSTGRKLSLFLLSLNRTFLFWNMESDVWFDIVYSRVCACLSAAVAFVKSWFKSKQNFDSGCPSSVFTPQECGRIQGLLEVILAAQISLLASVSYSFQSSCGNNGSREYDRVMSILGSALSNDSLLEFLFVSTQCVQNICKQRAGADGKANNDHMTQTSDINIFGLLCALSNIGSSFMVFFFSKCESAAREVYSLSCKKSVTASSGTSLLEPVVGETKKLFRRASILETMRAKHSSSTLLDGGITGASPAITKATIITTASDVDDEFSFPSEFNLKSDSGILEAVKKFLYEYKSMSSLLVCCRRDCALACPQTCLNAMVAIRHMLHILPLLRAAGYQASKPDGNLVLSSGHAHDAVVSSYFEIVDLCTSSALHLYLLDIILQVTAASSSSSKVFAKSSAPGFANTSTASLPSRQWDPSVCAGVGSLAAAAVNDKIELDGTTAGVTEASKSQVALFDKIMESASAVERYCAYVVKESDKECHHIVRNTDVFVAGDEVGSDEVSLLRGSVALEAVSLLSALVTASALIASWRSVQFMGSSIGASTESGVVDPNPKHTSLSRVVSKSVEESSGVAPTSIRNPVQQLLEQLMTPSLLYVMLTDRTTFLSIFPAHQASFRPLAIWTPDMKREMSKVVSLELGRIQAIERSGLFGSVEDSSPVTSLFCGGGHSPETMLIKDGFKGSYPTLADEVIVDGVYIRFLMETAGRDDIGVRYLPGFVEEIQTSLTSTRTVIGHINKSPNDAKQRRSSISVGNRQALATQLKMKQQVFEFMVNLHPELGFSNLNVRDETYF